MAGLVQQRTALVQPSPAADSAHLPLSPGPSPEAAAANSQLTQLRLEIRSDPKPEGFPSAEYHHRGYMWSPWQQRPPEEKMLQVERRFIVRCCVITLFNFTTGRSYTHELKTWGRPQQLDSSDAMSRSSELLRKDEVLSSAWSGLKYD